MPKNYNKNVPKHVAIIMDGNGRWAKKKAINRILGYEAGAESVKVITRVSKELGISYLTMYAFSEENWKRPKYEVSALMALFMDILMELMMTNVAADAVMVQKTSVRMKKRQPLDQIKWKTKS